MNVGKDKDDSWRSDFEKGYCSFDDDEFFYLKARFFQQKHGVHTGEGVVLDDANCLVSDTSHLT